MRSLTQLLSDNSPRSKPEIWRTPGATLRRRLVVWMNERLSPDWSRRPHIAVIGESRLLLEVIPSDVVGRPIALFGVYELAVTTLLTSYLRPADTFVDVGANLGYYTVLGGDAVGSAGRVVAFEPSKRIRSRLERNVALNGLSQVQVRGEAVADRDGTAKLVESDDKNNDGLGYLDATSDTGTMVPCVRLDDSFEDTPPALIKVDVEGGEAVVFAGAERLLAREDAPAIIFESFEIERDAAVLVRHGYRLFQPCLRHGRVGLTEDVKAPRYRRWEAPNFFAAKSLRALDFAESLLRS